MAPTHQLEVIERFGSVQAGLTKDAPLLCAVTMKTILLDVCHSSAVAAGEQHPGGRPAGSGEVPRYLEAGFRDARQQGVGRRQDQTDHHCLQRRYLPFSGASRVRNQQRGNDQAGRYEDAEADGRHLDRRRSYARHLRLGRKPLQGLLRPGRQATPQRVRFHTWEWLHPAILGAPKASVITKPDRSAIRQSLSGSASPSVDGFD